MKKIMLALGLSAFLFANTSCEHSLTCISGDGDIVTDTLDLETFTAINLQIPATVKLTQGNSQFVTVEAQQNIIDQLKTKVRNDSWEINSEDCLRNYDDMIINITMAKLTEVDIDGSGVIKGMNTFDNNNDLDIHIDGSGDVILTVNADEVRNKISGSGDIVLTTNATIINSRISGSGKIELTGDAQTHNINIDGSGDIESFDLPTEATNVDIKGSGSAEVRVSNTLDVVIDGSGDVYYKGSPTITEKIDGSGEIIDAN